MFELYISVLKTVIAVVAGICACAGLLTVALSGSGSVAELIGTVVGTALEGVLQAASWVTIGFFLTERYGIKQKPWTINDLAALAGSERR